VDSLTLGVVIIIVTRQVPTLPYFATIVAEHKNGRITPDRKNFATATTPAPLYKIDPKPAVALIFMLFNLAGPYWLLANYIIADIAVQAAPQA